jgi:hypothetical protein
VSGTFGGAMSNLSSPEGACVALKSCRQTDYLKFTNKLLICSVIVGEDCL